MKKDNFEIIKSMTTVVDSNKRFMDTPSYRNMLNNIHIGCYVEASTTTQYGYVKKIIRNKFGVPVCVHVLYEGGEENKKKYDYISVDRIDFYEPCNLVVANEEYYDDSDWDV